MSESVVGLSAENQDRNRVSDSEVAELVAQNHPCILSISRRDQGPIATPLWYEFRDGKFVMGIFPESAKGKLLRRRGRATVTIQTPVEPYRFVMVEGTARFVPQAELEERGETVWSVMRRIFDRYLETDVAERYEAVLPVLAPDYSIIEITPVSVRGESIPLHETIMPEIDQIPAFAKALEEGKSIEDARAELGLYVRPSEDR